MNNLNDKLILNDENIIITTTLSSLSIPIITQKIDRKYQLNQYFNDNSIINRIGMLHNIDDNVHNKYNEELISDKLINNIDEIINENSTQKFLKTIINRSLNDTLIINFNSSNNLNNITDTNISSSLILTSTIIPTSQTTFTLASTTATTQTTLLSTIDYNNNDEINETIGTIILEPDLRVHYPGLAFVLGIICIIVVFGNGLTMLSICKERYLRTVTNYFVASLAFADCLVGAIVMPFSVVHEVMNKWWIFGQDWCDLWHSFDVLASSASILNLCIISLDRYWAITDPITYPSRMTPRKAFIFILSLWLCSALISFPAIVWWRAVAKQPIESYRCTFTDDVGYIVFSSIISFYGPLTIMVFTYYRIYVVACEQNRSLKLGVKQIEMSFIGHHHHLDASHQQYPYHQYHSDNNDHHHFKYHHHQQPKNNQTNTFDNHNNPLNIDPDYYSGFALRIHRGGGAAAATSSSASVISNNATSTATTPVKNIKSMKLLSKLSRTKKNRNNNVINRMNRDQKIDHEIEILNNNKNQNNINNNNDNDTFNNNSNIINDEDDDDVDDDENNNNNGNEPKSETNQNVNRISSNNNSNVKKSQMKNIKQKPASSALTAPTIKANLSVGRRLTKLAKERKAAKTLGIVMGVFILCWLPFFVTNILMGICPESCIMEPDLVFSIVTWLGWLNSAMNPIIYACWSKDFRRAFRKLLCSCFMRNSTLSYNRNRIYKAHQFNHVNKNANTASTATNTNRYNLYYKSRIKSCNRQDFGENKIDNNDDNNIDNENTSSKLYDYDSNISNKNDVVSFVSKQQIHASFRNYEMNENNDNNSTVNTNNNNKQQSIKMKTISISKNQKENLNNDNDNSIFNTYNRSQNESLMCIQSSSSLKQSQLSIHLRNNDVHNTDDCKNKYYHSFHSFHSMPSTMTMNIDDNNPVNGSIDQFTINRIDGNSRSVTTLKQTLSSSNLKSLSIDANKTNDNINIDSDTGDKSNNDNGTDDTDNKSLIILIKPIDFEDLDSKFIVLRQQLSCKQDTMNTKYNPTSTSSFEMNSYFFEGNNGTDYNLQTKSDDDDTSHGSYDLTNDNEANNINDDG